MCKPIQSNNKCNKFKTYFSVAPSLRPSSNSPTLSATSIPPPVIFSSPNQVFNGSNFLLVKNFNTSFQWNCFTISAWIKASTSPTTVSSIVSLGRSLSNYNGEFVLSITNQKLNFFDFSYATPNGFSGSGKAVLSSGIVSY